MNGPFHWKFFEKTKRNTFQSYSSEYKIINERGADPPSPSIIISRPVRTARVKKVVKLELLASQK